jgi:hypothetical protein
VPAGNGVRASTASLYAASLAGSRRTSMSTRPMSTSIRLPRAAARNQLWVTGGNTSLTAIVSASGGMERGRARAAGRMRRAVAASALSMEPPRLPMPELSAVSAWRSEAGDPRFAESAGEPDAEAPAWASVSEVAEPPGLHAAREAVARRRAASRAARSRIVKRGGGKAWRGAYRLSGMVRPRHR